MESWNYKVFWDEALCQLSHELSEQEYSMWFNIEYKASNKDSVVVNVPSSLCRDQLVKVYQKKIEDMLCSLLGKPLAVVFEVGSVLPKQDTPRAEAVQEKKAPEAKKTLQHAFLSSKYTFDTYIVGENNSFAANAAVAIAKNPGIAYNPYLIYGNVGLGKTHLMQAIGNKAWELNPKLKIIYVSSENFTNEFVQAIGNKTMAAFKNRYRSADLLLIDDINFFQKKDSSQEELFHTFNALYDSGKQMVFTCDRPVSELKELSDRLRNRFERGLNVDLQPPNYEIRYAILEKKAKSQNFSINPEVFDIIAKNISTNVRDLESALTKLLAYSNLAGKEITLDIAKNLLKDVFSQTIHGNITVDAIMRCVSEEYKVGVNDLKSKKRTRSIVIPRQIAMYITREITEYSTTEIGLEFGGRDHTTAMHSCQKIEEALKLDPALDSKIKKIIQKIKNASVQN